MPVPKSKPCVERRHIVASLCWKPHDSRVREDRPGAPASRRAEPAGLFARFEHVRSPSPKAWEAQTA